MDKVQQLLIKMLKRNSFFADLCDESLIDFSNLFKLDMCSKWAAIIVEWHNPEYVFILKSWKLVAKKANGLNSIVLWYINEWEAFGEMSYFYDQPATATVVCESDSATYWKILRKDFDKFLKENPKVKTKIMEVLTKREKENKEKLWDFWKKKEVSEVNIEDIHINL